MKRTLYENSHGQLEWLDSALNSGLSPESFLVFEWGFLGGTPEAG
jgi:hypothetical protein